jgi:hypothetical protein
LAGDIPKRPDWGFRSCNGQGQRKSPNFQPNGIAAYGVALQKHYPTIATQNFFGKM